MSESGEAAPKAGNQQQEEENRAAPQPPEEEEVTVEEEVPLRETVKELANTEQGCWKVDGEGNRIALNDAQWREELAHLLARRPTAG